LSKNTGAIKRTQNFAIFFSRLTSKAQKKNKTEKTFFFKNNNHLMIRCFQFSEKKNKMDGRASQSWLAFRKLSKTNETKTLLSKPTVSSELNGIRCKTGTQGQKQKHF